MNNISFYVSSSSDILELTIVDIQANTTIFTNKISNKDFKNKLRLVSLNNHLPDIKTDSLISFQLKGEGTIHSFRVEI